MTLATRTTYRAIQLYAPDRRPCPVDLSDNTNRWGAPPSVMRAMQTLASERVTRYPDLYASPLKRALADYVGVDASMVVTGCGSDDVLDSAIRAFVEPNDLITMPEPSFPMIPLFAKMNGARIRGVSFDATLNVDVNALLADDPKIVYLCSPNNPTGTALPRATVEAVVERAPGLVIIDEAYAEFASDSFVDIAQKRKNVLVVRTMSKAFGLAGLRVGYGVGAPELAAEVEKSRGPYKISGIAEAAAVGALTTDIDWVRRHIALAIEARSMLTQALAERGVGVLPSASNFVLAPIADAPALALAMRDHGVALRAFDKLNCPYPALERTGGSALRITVGPESELVAALDALDKVRA